MPTYSDLSLDPLNTQPLVEDLAALKQSISYFLETRYGERMFRPEIGSRLPDFKFMNMDLGSEYDLLSTISTEIEEVDSRVTSLQGKSVSRPDYANHKWTVSAVLETKLGINQIGFTTPIRQGA